MDTLNIEKYGFNHTGNIFRNNPPGALVEKALLHKEGRLSRAGALCIETGERTGRSPDDKYIVDTPAVHDLIAWGNVNRPVSSEVFDQVYDQMIQYLNDKDLYIFDGFAGANRKYQYGFRVINEKASQNLFIRNLLIRPKKEQLKDFKEDFLILVAPGCKVDYKKLGLNSEAAIMINFEKQIILIAGTGYSGEIKKSVFCVMNYLLPQKKIFTMHCSANMGIDGDTALFFGLSGTGKTTLSADPNRRLIGDDEHGWSRNTIFNFEGGCYAKCINLSKEHEPEIWNAIRFGAVTENVKLFEDTRIINFDDGSITENTRVGYPIDYIPNTVSSGVGPIPRTIFFLAADAFGVLPPISKLDRNAAIYLALARGGDQVVVKNNKGISYYGGKREQTAKNTRVKARVKAEALREFITGKERVIVMGHKMADVDSFGAAIGIYRAASAMKKKVNIVLNDISVTLRPL